MTTEDTVIEDAVPMIAKIVEHRGYKIEVTSDYRFAVQTENGGYHQTLKAAFDEIDDHIKAVAKQKANEKLPPVEMLTNVGTALTVRGVHAGTGRLLTSDKDYDDPVYPNLPFLRQLLHAAHNHREAAKAIDRVTHKFMILNRRGYGRLAADHYDDVVRNLKLEIEKKTDAAKKYEEQNKLNESAARIVTPPVS